MVPLGSNGLIRFIGKKKSTFGLKNAKKGFTLIGFRNSLRKTNCFLRKLRTTIVVLRFIIGIYDEKL